MQSDEGNPPDSCCGQGSTGEADSSCQCGAPPPRRSRLKTLIFAVVMLGASLFGRGGFQHNPEFDTEQNLYFASHCTCATKLHGPKGKEATYDLRPFFHQMPKTLALDVQWPAGEPVTLFKYQSGKNLLDAWGGLSCKDGFIQRSAVPPRFGDPDRFLAWLGRAGAEVVASNG